jgi:hypothetical protein
MGNRWLWGLVMLVMAATSCSGQDLAESIVENRIESESGEDVDIEFGDDGLSIQTEDGEFSLDIDQDGDGNVSVTGSDEEGEFTIEAEDGEMTIESEEGSSTFSSSGDMPEGFPSDVPLPDDFNVQFSQVADTPEGQSFVLNGEVDGAPQPIMESYVAVLEGAGYGQQMLTTTPDSGFFVYDNGTYDVAGQVVAGIDAGKSTMNVTVSPSQLG